MTPNAPSALPNIRVGTGWLDLQVIGGPDVVLTFKGYAPVLPVRDLRSSLEYRMFISAKSLGEALEALRASNGGQFADLKFRVRKESEDKLSRYLVEPL